MLTKYIRGDRRAAQKHYDRNGWKNGRLILRPVDGRLLPTVIPSLCCSSRRPGLTNCERSSTFVNTHKLFAPLPDIDGILRRVSKGKYRSVIDEQDAYEQIWIVPEHVDLSAVTTPDGNMISTVIQIGD